MLPERQQSQPACKGANAAVVLTAALLLPFRKTSWDGQGQELTSALVCAPSCRIARSPAPDASACPPVAGCGHCKRLVPEYTKLGEKIASDPKLKNRVLIAKVDADAHRELGACLLPSCCRLTSASLACRVGFASRPILALAPSRDRNAAISSTCS